MNRSLICLLLLVIFICSSCKSDDVDTNPEIDPAEDLYGIWNRIEFGYRACQNEVDNTTQFGDGSVSFEKGGFYSTYSLRNGSDKVNTVKFEVEGDSIRFVNTDTKWKYDVVDDNLDLTTNATNGCVRYFNFFKSSKSF